ncbi:MAG: 4-hydroxy-3-methylbut-2-enyl diphosphate reductase [Lachnospiraceae bacterium]|nr:4-hydroxy-3-methylbut-2-enyl diphosphate reductase [Lachnospiraceae bacterium]
MEVILAKSAGFCFGVQRAVDMVEDEVKKGISPLYTYGPIIHNEQVTKAFEEKGVRVMDENIATCDIKEGTVVLRSHGVSKAVRNTLESQGLTISDATCPFVLKIHKAVEKYSDLGHFIIILGNDGHPEVEGIKGWCNGPFLVASNEEELDFSKIPLESKITVVAQTTFRLEKFKELVDFIDKKGYDVNVLDTICDATRKRQDEAAKIAGQVDAMLIIGGKNSSNTRKLYEICKGICPRTYFLQTAEDFDLSFVKDVKRLGITAGASTPNHIIKEVQKLCQI